MASANEEYALTWSDHANNLSHSFKNLLENKELLDVTLVADGHLFDAHRLVLSAISPNFRQMFAQMPANQQAFVFMKDVSKQTLEHLITFIYCGEVKVNEDDLKEFFNCAKALKITGLDEHHVESFNSAAAPAKNRLQYQSSQTVNVNAAPVFSLPAPVAIQSYPDPSNGQENFDFGETNDGAESTYDTSDDHNNYQRFDMDGEDLTMDNAHVPQSNKRNADGHFVAATAAVGKETKAMAPKAKRSKRTMDQTGYDIIADIRENKYGKDNLFHKGYKFTKGHLNNIKQGWQCSKDRKCRAYVSTVNIDGLTMMKIFNDEHCHAR